MKSWLSGPTECLQELCEGVRISITWVEFADVEKRGWITRKKNLITELATGEIIVFMHDYFSLEPGWYKGISDDSVKFQKFDVGTNRIVDIDGHRFADWTLHPLNYSPIDLFTFPNLVLLPYRVSLAKNYQYIPGGFFIARRDFMKTFPLDEQRMWGDGEDVEWSFRWRTTKARLVFFPNAVVTLLKQGKKTKFKQIPFWRLVCIYFLCLPGIRFVAQAIHFDVRALRRKLGLSDSIEW